MQRQLTRYWLSDVDLIAFISQPIVIQTGAVGILLLVITLILSGRLVPRAVLVDRIKDKDDIIARLEREKEQWHTAHTISETGRAELKDQNGKLIQGQDNMNRFVDEFHRYFGTHDPTSKPIDLRQIEGQ